MFQPAERPFCHNGCVRRLLAISLLILLGLPIALRVFGTGAAATTLPTCCRRDGKHHCSMSMGASNPATRTIAEKCPYSKPSPAIPVLRSSTPTTAASIFAGVVQHTAFSPQTEAQRRISFDRTRQKRGPPTQVA